MAQTPDGRRLREVCQGPRRFTGTSPRELLFEVVEEITRFPRCFGGGSGTGRPSQGEPHVKNGKFALPSPRATHGGFPWPRFWCESHTCPVEQCVPGTHFPGAERASGFGPLLPFGVGFRPPPFRLTLPPLFPYHGTLESPQVASSRFLGYTRIIQRYVCRTRYCYSTPISAPSFDDFSAVGGWLTISSCSLFCYSCHL